MRAARHAGTRQLSAVFGTGVLPQPGLDSLGSINTQAANPVVTPAASPAAAPLGAAAAAPAQAPAALAAPAAAPAQTELAPVPADVAVVAPAPASKAAVSGAAFGAHAPAPGPSAARRRRVALRNSVFILDADYATLTIPDPNNPDDGTLEVRVAASFPCVASQVFVELRMAAELIRRALKLKLEAEAVLRKC